MKELYVIKFKPANLWITLKDSNNHITLGSFEDSKIYQRKPAIISWFLCQKPLIIQGYDLIIPSDFLVDSFIISYSYKSILRHYLFNVYKVLSFIFKCLVWPFKSIVVLYSLIIEKIEKLKRLKKQSMEEEMNIWIREHT